MNDFSRNEDLGHNPRQQERIDDMIADHAEVQDRWCAAEDSERFYMPANCRCDGWTPERQKAFLQAVSEGYPVVHACRIAAMSKQSAYAFRRRPEGAAFALAWDAATLLARDFLADALMQRAIEGTREIIMRDGQVIERRKHDNRLAMALLNRLDRRADRARGEASQSAARLIAAEFDTYLDCLDRGPARAGMFLGARAEEAGEADLAPLRALARADRWLRTHTTLGDDIDISDLDPAQRHGWSDAQWRRAEAAGLVGLAPEAAAPENPPAENPSESQFGQLRVLEIGEDGDVWWDELYEQWCTRFPPPKGFTGFEACAYGEEDYARALTLHERAIVDAQLREEAALARAEDDAERDACFGFAGDDYPASATARDAVAEDQGDEDEEDDGEDGDDEYDDEEEDGDDGATLGRTRHRE